MSTHDDYRSDPAAPLELTAGVLETFVTDRAIRSHRRVARVWARADLHDTPVLEPDQRAEGRTLAYPSLVRDPDGDLRMYYTSFAGYRELDHARHTGRLFSARSTDGLAWTRPDVGDGSHVTLETPRHLDSPNVVVREDWDPPWAMIAFEASTIRVRDDWGLYLRRSPDGLHWDEGRRVLPSLDRNTLVRDPATGDYLSFNRHLAMFEHVGRRAIYLSRSPDLVDWSEPELVLAPDLEDAADTEFYGMSVFWRDGYFWGLLEVWSRRQDTFVIELVVSLDGRAWRRPSRGVPFIAPTSAWNRRWTTAASGDPIVIEDRLAMVVNGRNVAHGWSAIEQHGVFGLASIPRGRWCALEGHADGVVETVAMRWPGGKLLLNADTRGWYGGHPGDVEGSIAVEVLDADLQPIEGFSGTERGTLVANTVARREWRDAPVAFPGERSLEALRGERIHLRFHLDQARLYGFAASGWA